MKAQKRNAAAKRANARKLHREWMEFWMDDVQEWEDRFRQMREERS